MPTRHSTSCTTGSMTSLPAKQIHWRIWARWAGVAPTSCAARGLLSATYWAMASDSKIQVPSGHSSAGILPGGNLERNSLVLLVWPMEKSGASWMSRPLRRAAARIFSVSVSSRNVESGHDIRDEVRTFKMRALGT